MRAAMLDQIAICWFGGFMYLAMGIRFGHVRSTRNELLKYLENRLTSPNFILTSIPTLSAATLDMTPLSTSSRKLKGKTVENAASDGFLENGSSYGHQILHAYRGQ